MTRSTNFPEAYFSRQYLLSFALNSFHPLKLSLSLSLFALTNFTPHIKLAENHPTLSKFGFSFSNELCSFVAR